jgi:N-acetylmuramoyl-L-alanine amidase
MFKWFRKLWHKLTYKKPDVKEEEHEDETRSDNMEGEEIKEPSKKMLKWYPDRKRGHATEDQKQRTRGGYKNDHPKGAVVHFTAGRSRPAALGGKRNSKTAEGQANRSVESSTRKGSYTYFVIDADGGVYQNFPLDRWGYHAGKSSYKGLSGTVSDELVGIEIMCAGKLKKADNGKHKAWFTTTSKGDAYFEDNEVRHVTKRHNILHSGSYHKYTARQEEGLFKLLRWLEYNGNGIFKMDLVLGHDEVAPGRKNDPGGSLSMTMPELRKKLKE